MPGTLTPGDDTSVMRVLLHAGATGYDTPVMLNTLQKSVHITGVSVMRTPEDLARLNGCCWVQRQQYAVKRHSLVRSHHYTLTEVLLQSQLQTSQKRCNTSLACVYSASLHQHTLCCMLLITQTVQNLPSHGYIGHGTFCGFSALHLRGLHGCQQLHQVTDSLQVPNASRLLLFISLHVLKGSLQGCIGHVAQCRD